MSNPLSLRNIPRDAMRYATQISARTGLSMSDVFRLALLSGCLVELTKLAPDADGNYGDIEVQVLARTLRRHLASAIDLLLEQGQHPSLGALQGGHSVSSPSVLSTHEYPEKPATVFDQALCDDLERLGMGFGLSE